MTDKMTECVRRIDVQDEIDRWLDSVGTIMVGKGLSSYGELVGCLKDAPAADVAPVVHGRWDGNDCTVCKLPWNYNMVQDADDWGYFDPMPDYCPNCGAKMDADESEVR